VCVYTCMCVCVCTCVCVCVYVHVCSCARECSLTGLIQVSLQEKKCKQNKKANKHKQNEKANSILRRRNPTASSTLQPNPSAPNACLNGFSFVDVSQHQHSHNYGSNGKGCHIVLQRIYWSQWLSLHHVLLICNMYIHMYICVYMYIHTYTYIYTKGFPQTIYTYIHTSVYICKVDWPCATTPPSLALLYLHPSSDARCSWRHCEVIQKAWWPDPSSSCRPQTPWSEVKEMCQKRLKPIN